MVTPLVAGAERAHLFRVHQCDLLFHDVFERRLESSQDVHTLSLSPTLRQADRRRAVQQPGLLR